MAECRFLNLIKHRLRELGPANAAQPGTHSEQYHHCGSVIAEQMADLLHDHCTVGVPASQWK